MSGSSPNQVLYLLNGFNLTNPISGQFQTLLAVEGIRSLDLSSGRSSAEFGKGIGGRAGHQHRQRHGRFPLHGDGFFSGDQHPTRPASGKLVSAVWSFRADRARAAGVGSPILSIWSTAKRRSRDFRVGRNITQRVRRQQPDATTQVNLTAESSCSLDFLANVGNE